MPTPSSYPVIGVGDYVTADLLTSMTPSQVVKASSTSRNTTVSLTADPDLSAITLAVGTYEIELNLFWSCTSTATQGLTTQWGFSGTWNNPVRGLIGQGNASPGTPRDSVATVNMAGIAANNTGIYYVTNNAGYTLVREFSSTVTVSAVGDLSLLWAQAASSANPTIVQPGSTFRIRQIG